MRLRQPHFGNREVALAKEALDGSGMFPGAQAMPGNPGDIEREMELMIQGEPGRPLRTFIRRLEIPAGGEPAVQAESGAVEGGAAPAPAAGAADEELRRELEQLRAMLDALQKRLK